MYLLRRSTQYRIAWPALRTSGPARFRLAGSLKAAVLPTSRSLYVRRQTPLLPVFPKDDSPSSRSTQAAKSALKEGR